MICFGASGLRVFANLRGRLRSGMPEERVTETLEIRSLRFARISGEYFHLTGFSAENWTDRCPPTVFRLFSRSFDDPRCVEIFWGPMLVSIPVDPPMWDWILWGSFCWGFSYLDGYLSLFILFYSLFWSFLRGEGRLWYWQWTQRIRDPLQHLKTLISLLWPELSGKSLSNVVWADDANVMRYCRVSCTLRNV